MLAKHSPDMHPLFYSTEVFLFGFCFFLGGGGQRHTGVQSQLELIQFYGAITFEIISRPVTHMSWLTWAVHVPPPSCSHMAPSTKADNPQRKPQCQSATKQKQKKKKKTQTFSAEHETDQRVHKASCSFQRSVGSRVNTSRGFYTNSHQVHGYRQHSHRAPPWVYTHQSIWRIPTSHMADLHPRLNLYSLWVERAKQGVKEATACVPRHQQHDYNCM